jgi:hypothetical protein
MTLAAIDSEIDAEELTTWQAFYELEPWGFVMDNFRAGIIAATYANMQRSSKSASPPMLALDLFKGIGIMKILTKEKEPVETPEQVARNVKAYIMGVEQAGKRS